jgi:pimeloyl-ACP methyl ester carboxylesterase
LKEDINLPKIRVKTLVIWGEEDEFVDRLLGPMNRDYVEDMTFVPIAGVGHFCHEHVPDKVHKAMEDFLKGRK